MNARVRLAWRAVFAAFAVELILIAIAGVWSLLAFAVFWGVGVGALGYHYRDAFARGMRSAGLAGFTGFAATVLVVSVAEESLCASLGCTLAVADLWVDLIFVPILWLAWLTAWYFLIARRYRFEPDEALLVAAAAGVLFEIVGNGRVLADPFIALLSVPGAIVVYAAICVLPMSLIEWTGARDTRAKYPIAFFLPYLAALLAAVALFILLSSAGVPL